MDQIDQLGRRGDVSPEEITALRFSMEAHRAVMAGAAGESGRVTKSVVMDALEASREAASEPERAARRAAEIEAEGHRERVSKLLGERQDAASEAEKLRAAVAKLEGRAEAQLESIERQARSDVKLRMRIGLGLATVLGVACVLLPNADGLPDVVGRPLLIGGCVLAALGVLTLVLGGSVKAVADKLEEPLARRRALSLRRRLHLQDDDSRPPEGT